MTNAPQKLLSLVWIIVKQTYVENDTSFFPSALRETELFVNSFKELLS